MLSLSPRYDLFKFELPKTFLPKEVNEKYQKLLSTSGVLKTPIDYLNESIQGINIPGMSDLTIDQQQHSKNSIKGLGKINVEPSRNNTYKSPANPLDKIDKEITVTFRFNQGFYNYFMLYETIFWKFCKPTNEPNEDVLYIDLLDETGRINARVKYEDCVLDKIDGLDFTYSKIERDTSTFDITFKFNNIDFIFFDKNGKEV